MGDTDLQLRRYRVDVHSLAVGFPEPASVYKLKMEFMDDFGEEVPFRKFGYMTFEAFLMDHPDMEHVFVDGKPCFRAKLSERTADIQSLVSRQKKKKRKANNFNKRREPFQRNVQTRSFQARPSAPSSQFNRNQWNSFRGGRNGSSSLQPTFNRTFPSNASSTFTGFTVPKSNPTTSNPIALDGPATGKSRIVAALQKCQGKATLTKLNYAYQLLYKCQLDCNEMTKHFKTANFHAIHKDYLSEEMDVNAGADGQWVFRSKDIVQKQQDWTAANRNNIVITASPRIHWDKPTIKALYDNVVAMLVNMYPTPLDINNIAEIYKRAHGVHVDPMELYCKSWKELVSTTFRDKMQFNADGNVVLCPKAIVSNGLSNATKTTIDTPTVKRVTAADLGLEYVEEESSDDADTVSTISSVSLPSTVVTEEELKNYGRIKNESQVTDKTEKRDPAPMAPRIVPVNLTSQEQHEAYMRARRNAAKKPAGVMNQRANSHSQVKERPIFNKITNVTELERREVLSHLTLNSVIKVQGTIPAKPPMTSSAPVSSGKECAPSQLPSNYKSVFELEDPLESVSKCLNQELMQEQSNCTANRQGGSSRRFPVSQGDSEPGFWFLKNFTGSSGFGIKKIAVDKDYVSVFQRDELANRSVENPYDNVWSECNK